MLNVHINAIAVVEQGLNVPMCYAWCTVVFNVKKGLNVLISVIAMPGVDDNVEKGLNKPVRVIAMPGVVDNVEKGLNEPLE